MSITLNWLYNHLLKQLPFFVIPLIWIQITVRFFRLYNDNPISFKVLSKISETMVLFSHNPFQDILEHPFPMLLELISCTAHYPDSVVHPLGNHTRFRPCAKKDAALPAEECGDLIMRIKKSAQKGNYLWCRKKKKNTRTLCRSTLICGLIIVLGELEETRKVLIFLRFRWTLREFLWYYSLWGKVENFLGWRCMESNITLKYLILKSYFRVIKLIQIS